MRQGITVKVARILIPSAVIGNRTDIWDYNPFCDPVRNDHVRAEFEFGFDVWVNDWLDATNLNLARAGHVEDGRICGRRTAREGRIVRILLVWVCVHEEVSVEVGRNASDVSLEPIEGRHRNGRCGWGLVIEFDLQIIAG